MGKITDTELQRLQLLKQDSIEVATTLGQLSYQKISLELLIDEQKKKIEEIKKREAQILEELQSTYGNVGINIDTGEFQ
jgi:hypothetical protein